MRMIVFVFSLILLSSSVFADSSFRISGCNYADSQKRCENNIRDKSENIINIFKDKNKKKLINYIDYNKNHIPSREFVESHSFDELISPQMREAVINAKDVTKMGYRGIMFGNGYLWLDEYNGKIINNPFSIEEKFTDKTLPKGWYIGESLLTPDVFVVEWMSSDNFEEISEHFNIDYADLYEHTGKFLGKYSLKVEKPSWCMPSMCNPVTLIKPAIANEKYKLDIDKNGNIYFTKEVYKRTLRDNYTLMKEITKSLAKKLAPNYRAKFIKGYLVERTEESGGSIGDFINYGIYGLYEENGEKVIAPLKYFRNKNEAIRYFKRIDTQG